MRYENLLTIFTDYNNRPKTKPRSIQQYLRVTEGNRCASVTHAITG